MSVQSDQSNQSSPSNSLSQTNKSTLSSKSNAESFHSHHHRCFRCHRYFGGCRCHRHMYRQYKSGCLYKSILKMIVFMIAIYLICKMLNFSWTEQRPYIEFM